MAAISSILIAITMFFGTWGLDSTEVGDFAYEAGEENHMTVSFYEDDSCRLMRQGESFEGMWYFDEDEQTGKAMFPGIQTVFELEMNTDDDGIMELRMTDTDDIFYVYCFSFMGNTGE